MCIFIDGNTFLMSPYGNAMHVNVVFAQVPEPNTDVCHI